MNIQDVAPGSAMLSWLQDSFNKGAFPTGSCIESKRTGELLGKVVSHTQGLVVAMTNHGPQEYVPDDVVLYGEPSTHSASDYNGASPTHSRHGGPHQHQQPPPPHSYEYQAQSGSQIQHSRTVLPSSTGGGGPGGGISPSNKHVSPVRNTGGYPAHAPAEQEHPYQQQHPYQQEQQQLQLPYPKAQQQPQYQQASRPYPSPRQQQQQQQQQQ
eukprot:Rhum_TRINITY_DN23493_c0_g1::Rhum_TRINITY_DN23493_c0_g1_i1::g.177898::m.177898